VTTRCRASRASSQHASSSPRNFARPRWAPPQHDPGDEAGEERNAEIHQHAAEHLARAHRDRRRRQAEHRRQHCGEEPRVDAVEQHLEDAVECDEPRGVLVRAAREVVPHQHHRDASRRADEDEADHVVGLITEQHRREPEHEQRPDDPVEHQREHEHSPIAEHLAELLVAHLRQRRVHHEDEPDRDRHVGRADVEAMQQLGRARHEVAERDAEHHREEDPRGEVAVEERQARGRAHASATRENK